MTFSASAGVKYKIGDNSTFQNRVEEKIDHSTTGALRDLGPTILPDDTVTAIVGTGFTTGKDLLIVNDTGSSISMLPSSNIDPWEASTAYVAGDYVMNDTNKKLYRCATGGTSAGSGGPTGRTTGITDNGATWDYVCDYGITIPDGAELLLLGGSYQDDVSLHQASGGTLRVKTIALGD